MREVDEAFRAWTDHDETSYAEIGHHLLAENRGGGDAA
jgi:hypothetical protein